MYLPLANAGARWPHPVTLNLTFAVHHANIVRRNRSLPDRIPTLSDYRCIPQNETNSYEISTRELRAIVVGNRVVTDLFKIAHASRQNCLTRNRLCGGFEREQEEKEDRVDDKQMRSHP